jgi:hydroxypyruvate reductase
LKAPDVLRANAASIWAAALRSADPDAAIRKIVKKKDSWLQIGHHRFNLDQFGKLWILGAGKAAASMGQTMEKILGPHLSGGIVVTKYGHSLPLKKLEVLEAAHPLPDRQSLAAASRISAFIKERIESRDLVVCLLSGGASALMVSPAENISLEDKLECVRLLMNSGAGIFELNVVRKHLSEIKGGGLARMLAPTPVVSLILSDVVGDDVSTIASGPLSPDPSTFNDCLEILQKRSLLKNIPLSIRKRFKLGAAGRIPETPRAGDPIFQKCVTFVIGSNAQACTAAAQTARRLGYNVAVLTSRLEGDTEEAARFHMSIAEEIADLDRPLRRPACILSGGETTVQVKGKGKGGRNQEFVLHCVRSLARMPVPCLVASLGTDGTDGPTDAAGAIADNATFSRSLKINPDFLNTSSANNDSYEFFKRLQDLIITGPTQTNVMDLHIVLIG